MALANSDCAPLAAVKANGGACFNYRYHQLQPIRLEATTTSSYQTLRASLKLK